MTTPEQQQQSVRPATMTDLPTASAAASLPMMMMPPTKPLSPSLLSRDYLYGGGKGYLSSSSPDSLNRLMIGRSSLKAARANFLMSYNEKRLKTVNFDSQQAAESATTAAAPVSPAAAAPTASGEVDYGYGEDYVAPPPVKRRRFERRNSKTPAMLLAMSSSLVTMEILKEQKEERKKTQAAAVAAAAAAAALAASSTTTTLTSSKTAAEDDDDNWDGGLEIAEELVKHLQKRRNSNNSQQSGRGC